MKDSALSVANYFVDVSKSSGTEIMPLKLMKLVYIAHGFMLALMNRSVFNPRFDRVEAWRLGPVVPSVYHSFKQYKNAPITEKTVVFKYKGDTADDATGDFVVPDLQDNDAKKVCDIVWKRYSGVSDGEIEDLLHGKATPWANVYVPGMNREIPDELTRLYYRGLIRRLIGGSNGKN